MLQKLYDKTLKNDLWTHLDLILLFEIQGQTEINEFMDLLFRSVAAKKLTPITTMQEVDRPNKLLDRFDPITITEYDTSSVAAKKLTPNSTRRAINNSDKLLYCFDPVAICAWAIDKEIPFPDRLQKWYAEKNKPKHAELPEYLNAKHPLHSSELSIAILAWEAVLQSNPPRPKSGSRKQLIESWLKKEHGDLKKAEVDRITAMINPDKSGGAPKTE